jgi:hypothetical protein
MKKKLETYLYAKVTAKKKKIIKIFIPGAENFIFLTSRK